MEQQTPTPPDTSTLGYPYNRIVQWAAGPVAAAVGMFVAWLGTKVGIVAGHADSVQHSVTAAAIFAVGALVTYAAHHKWLENLARYVDATHYSQPASGVTTTVTAPVDEPAPSPADEQGDVAGIDEVPDGPVSAPPEG